MKFSRWKYVDVTKSFEDILDNILNYEEWKECIIDPVDENELLFEINHIYSEEIKLSNEDSYKYSVFRFKYERLIEGERLNTDRNVRIHFVESYIMIYMDNNETYLCINRSGSPALSILRKFNNIEMGERGVIIPDDYNTSKDFISWLFYGKNVLNIIDNQNSLEIKKITGFKGNVTSPSSIVSQITGKGNEIMNALSTLAFMFETEEITYVQLKVEYMKEHDLEFGLNINGTVEFDLDKYNGNLFFGNDDMKYAKILLLISTHIFPKIKKYHIFSSNNDLWGLKIKIEKIQAIGDLIQSQVGEKITLLKDS